MFLVSHCLLMWLRRTSKQWDTKNMHLTKHYFAASEELDHTTVEGGNVLRASTAHPVAIPYHFLIHPGTTRVADIILNGVVAGQCAAFH